MKKLGLLCVMAVTLLFVTSIESESFAQGKSKAKGNSGEVKKKGPPSWAPAHGYRSKTRYVFFRDYDVYYDLDREVYISLSGSNWSVSAQLPVKLKSVNLSAAVQVEIDLDSDDPQKYHKSHKK